MMDLDDDRTSEQRKTHTWLVIGTDSFLSGWGRCKNATSYAVWACLPENRQSVLDWVSSRKEMKRVREYSEAYARPYRPRGNGHCHIYVVEPGHPSL